LELELEPELEVELEVELEPELEVELEPVIELVPEADIKELKIINNLEDNLEDNLEKVYSVENTRRLEKLLLKLKESEDEYQYACNIFKMSEELVTSKNKRIKELKDKIDIIKN
jgi:pilus assembly protein FimV